MSVVSDYNIMINSSIAVYDYPFAQGRNRAHNSARHYCRPRANYGTRAYPTTGMNHRYQLNTGAFDMSDPLFAHSIVTNRSNSSLTPTLPFRCGAHLPCYRKTERFAHLGPGVIQKHDVLPYPSQQRRFSHGFSMSARSQDQQGSVHQVSSSCPALKRTASTARRWSAIRQPRRPYTDPTAT